MPEKEVETGKTETASWYARTGTYMERSHDKSFPSFPDLLNRYLRRKGEPLATIAEKAGIKAGGGYLTRLRKGERKGPAPALVEKLATVLELTPDEREEFKTAARISAESQPSVKAGGFRAAHLPERSPASRSVPTEAFTLTLEMDADRHDLCLLQISKINSVDASKSYRVRVRITDKDDEVHGPALIEAEPFRCRVPVGKLKITAEVGTE